jgi:hypothetical protein
MMNPSKLTLEKLAKIGRTETGDSEESIRKMFVKAGLSLFDPVIQSFQFFGGYVLPFKEEGRFRILRVKAAIRMLRLNGDLSTDPSRFRIPFGESETIQSLYSMDGHGHLYEDDLRIADSLAVWVEAWAKCNHV